LSDHLALALYNGKKVSDLETSHQALEAQVASTVQELSRTNTRLVQKVRELKDRLRIWRWRRPRPARGDIVRVMVSGIKELIDVHGAAFFLFEENAVTLKPILPLLIWRPPRRKSSAANP